MRLRRSPVGTVAGVALGVALAVAPVAILAQFTTPNVISTPGDITTTLGPSIFINHGLVGVGRISASMLDSFGESFGSVSSLQVTGWTNLGNGSYGGTFNILPDRGYNSGSFFADYAARIQQVGFAFTPYTGSSNIGGSSVAEKIAAQNQIVFTSGISGVKLTYLDPIRGTLSVTTGLDPAGGFATIFGRTLPYVSSYTGFQSPSSTGNTTYPGINKLPLDSEALALKADGSGYVGDEYGAYIYYFNASKQILGVIVPPAALVPHESLGGPPNFGAAASLVNGRRVNQGMEGVALSPDGTRLFALLQSAAIQDSNANSETRRQTRLLVYDVSSNAVPVAPVAEYALTLPTYRSTGNGGAVNSTAAQSEIVALDNNRLLVLSRDGNGQGNASSNPSVIKSILLVDTRVGSPTDLAGDQARNGEGGAITSSAGVLAAGIVPLSRVEAINMLNSTQLEKFNVQLDTGAGQVSQLTLGEKWEGLSLVPANDPGHPDDYFLFVANDNDFLTSSGFMRGPDGTIVAYDGFSGYPANRLPANAGSGSVNANDTMFLAFRVTISAVPDVVRSGFVFDRRTSRFVQQVTIRNNTANVLTGPVHLALDGLSSNATLANATGTTLNNAPVGSPYITVLGNGNTVAPGGAINVVLQFANPAMTAITYTSRVLALSSPATP